MRNWRIFRLPGSRQFWHIDYGPGTPVVNVTSYRCAGPSWSVDSPNTQPRAWIEIPGCIELHIVDGAAVFDYAKVVA